MIPYLSKQVAALRQITQKDLIDFFNEYTKVGTTGKERLGVGDMRGHMLQSTM